MKTRKAVLVLVALGCLLAAFNLEANAAWYLCTIDQVGPYGLTDGVSGSLIYLTHNADDPAWEGSKKFNISPQRGKEFLAAALTALASGKQVNVIIINPALANPNITAILIQK